MDSSGSSGGSSAGGNSLASIGLSAYATILQSQGVAAGDNYQAAKLDQAAQYGDLKAVQTGGQMTRQLNQTLGNIDAVRAAAGADPNSPTGAAFRDNQETIGATNRGIAVGSILAQANQDRNDAAYYRSAASDALFAGYIGAGAGIAKGLAGLGSGSGSAPAGRSIGDPTQIGSLY
jgi:hypothetical protein